MSLYNKSYASIDYSDRFTEIVFAVWWLVCAISFFRLSAWRYFVFSPRQNAKWKDEKTPREKTK